VAEADVYSIAATTHGRVLVRRAAAPRRILAGFHGYLENAAIQLARLESIPGADRCRRCTASTAAAPRRSSPAG